MVTVVLRERKSAVLTPSSLACLAAMPSINLTAGCAHGCVYCYTRGYSTYPGDGRVVLYTNTLEKLKGELARKRVRPKAVYFSPSSDVFQPVPEVLAMAYEVMAFLLSNGVGVAFLTKGEIPARHMALLAAHASLVRAQVGLTTLDEGVIRTLEPYAAPPEARLAQIKALIDAGIATEVRLDPVVPGMTDSDESLAALLAAVGGAGVENVAVSALFLRPSLLSATHNPEGWRLLHGLKSRFFCHATRLGIHAERSQVLALEVEARELLYARVRLHAERIGLKVRICGCKNPDISKGSCNIAGRWSEVARVNAATDGQREQGELFPERGEQ